jgi:uracil-DNA glycosylase
LGTVAHLMSLRALGVKVGGQKFSHGAVHEPLPGMMLANSYHVSRYNTSTKRLNREMFEAVVAAMRDQL